MHHLFALRFGSYLGMFAFLLFLERLAPFAEPEQRKPFRVFLHLGLSLMNSVVLYALMAWPIYLTLSFARSNEIGLAPFLGLTGWVEIALTVIAFDFWDYWMHRANHKVGFLWRFHKAHHTDMELDVTTASRFHIGELLISNCVKCLVILAWGPSFWGLVCFDVLMNGSSQFHHGNIKIPLGTQDVLEKIIVSPRMHRCHHALHHSCTNTNFSTILSIWDRIARSYHWTGDLSELAPLGVPMPRGPSTMQLKPILLTPFERNLNS